MNVIFYLNSVLLGIGLAMDAFSVSLANGLNEPNMRWRKIFFVAGVFAFFQGLMPLIGWFCVHSVVEYFTHFAKFIPWIALFLLALIGAKMIFDGVRCECEECRARIGFGALLVQGIATSIDALSVGFTISEYDAPMALAAALIISAVTFLICTVGVFIGKKAGTFIAGKAGIFGGVILIIIGIEIFVTGIV